MITFTSPSVDTEIEITGHIVAHLNFSMSALHASTTPSDLDLFLTLRHLDKHDKEIFYTGTIGDPAPITKGWLRGSLRKTNDSGFHHESWLPQRESVLPMSSRSYPTMFMLLTWKCGRRMLWLKKGAGLRLKSALGTRRGLGRFVMKIRLIGILTLL
jgi:hypothetical protein